jgi:hypothetical protein
MPRGRYQIIFKTNSILSETMKDLKLSDILDFNYYSGHEILSLQ